MTPALPTTTVEVRWFVRGAVPPAVRAWFDGLGAPPDVERRTDRYLAPTDPALGLKWRDGDGGPAVEPKRRDGVGDRLAVGRAEAPVETWTKWSLPTRAEAPNAWLAVDKERRQHRTETSEAGCALELTLLCVGREAWWTVALEATADADPARRRLLAAAAARWLNRGDAPALPHTAAMGYPAWLLARAA